MGDTLFDLGFSTEQGWHTPPDGELIFIWKL